MNLQELCNLADQERNKPINLAMGLLRKILTWFQTLPEHFDEEALKQGLLEAVAYEDDTFECSFSQPNIAKISIYNYAIEKQIELSEEEISMLNDLEDLLSAPIYSIAQDLSNKLPTEIFFYFEEDDAFWKFYYRVQEVLPNMEIDFEYNKNVSEHDDHLACMYVYSRDLPAI